MLRHSWNGPALEAPSPKKETATRPLPVHLRREPRAGDDRDAAGDDAVGAEHADAEIGDVHGAALALAVAGLPAVELGHHALEVGALGDAVAVAAMRRDDLVAAARAPRRRRRRRPPRRCSSARRRRSCRRGSRPRPAPRSSGWSASGAACRAACRAKGSWADAPLGRLSCHGGQAPEGWQLYIRRRSPSAAPTARRSMRPRSPPERSKRWCRGSAR